MTDIMDAIFVHDAHMYIYMKFVNMVKALRENKVMDVYEPKAKPGNPLDMVMGLFKW